MSAPLVSIVIPNYNHSRHLPERFSSIFAQEFGAAEIIFMDDGSTDQSVAYAKAVNRKHPMRMLLNSANQGVFVQWKRAVAEAKGEFIWIAESDDASAPDFLRTLIEKLEADQAAGFAYAQSRIIDEAGRILEPTPNYLKSIGGRRWERDYTADGVDEVTNYLFLRNTVPNVSACVFRRSALQDVDFDLCARFKLCGDWLAYAQILRRYRVVYCAAPLNYYRRHAQTVRAASDRDGLRILESYQAQKIISGWFAITGETRSLAARFTFEEWLYLRNMGQDPASGKYAGELWKAAQDFDPSVEKRFSDPGLQSLPVITVRYRSWRTLWIWRLSIQRYRDDRPVEVDAGLVGGSIEIDFLGRSGCVVVRSVECVTNGKDSLARVLKPTTEVCFGPVVGAESAILPDGGIEIRRGLGDRVWTRLKLPSPFKGRRMLLRISLHAKPAAQTGASGGQ